MGKTNVYFVSQLTNITNQHSITKNIYVIGSINCQVEIDSNDDQKQIFEGISEIRGGLSKEHVWPLNNKISLQILYVWVHNGLTL